MLRRDHINNQHAALVAHRARLHLPDAAHVPGTAGTFQAHAHTHTHLLLQRTWAQPPPPRHSSNAPFFTPPRACSALASILAVSSVLYASDAPADQISQVLAVCAAVNYLVFDGTKQGLALALICALVCPASEVSAARRQEGRAG